MKKQPAVRSRLRSYPRRRCASPALPSQLPTWLEIPQDQQRQLVAVLTQMILAHLHRRGAEAEGNDELVTRE